MAVDVESIMRAVSSPRRRRILQLVWTKELSAGDIAEQFDVTWGAVSQNLRVLRDANLLETRREGTHRYYRAIPEALGPVRAVLEQMWQSDLARLKHAVEADMQGRRRSNGG